MGGGRKEKGFAGSLQSSSRRRVVLDLNNPFQFVPFLQDLIPFCPALRFPHRPDSWEVLGWDWSPFRLHRAKSQTSVCVHPRSSRRSGEGGQPRRAGGVGQKGL